MGVLDRVRMYEAIMADKSLTTYERVILFDIYRRCYGEKESCYPSVESICSITGICERQVRENIKTLKQKDKIRIEKRDGSSSVYFINKYPGKICTPAQHAPLTNVQAPPACYAPLPRHDMHPNTGNLNTAKFKTDIEAKASICDTKKPKIEKSQKDKTADPRITGLFKHYHDEHLRVYGTKPYISGGKDGKIFKRMLEQLTAAEIKERMTRFFNDPLDRLKDPHHTLPLFESMINRYSSNGNKPAEPPKKVYDPEAWLQHHVIMTPLIPSEQRFPYKVRASVYWEIFYSFTLRIYGEDYHENEEKVIKINRALIKEGKINGWEEDYYKITGRSPDTNVQYQV